MNDLVEKVGHIWCDPLITDHLTYVVGHPKPIDKTSICGFQLERDLVNMDEVSELLLLFIIHKWVQLT